MPGSLHYPCILCLGHHIIAALRVWVTAQSLRCVSGSPHHSYDMSGSPHHCCVVSGPPHHRLAICDITAIRLYVNVVRLWVNVGILSVNVLYLWVNGVLSGSMESSLDQCGHSSGSAGCVSVPHEEHNVATAVRLWLSVVCVWVTVERLCVNVCIFQGRCGIVCVNVGIFQSRCGILCVNVDIYQSRCGIRCVSVGLALDQCRIFWDNVGISLDQQRNVSRSLWYTAASM